MEGRNLRSNVLTTAQLQHTVPHNQRIGRGKLDRSISPYVPRPKSGLIVIGTTDASGDTGSLVVEDDLPTIGKTISQPSALRKEETSLQPGNKYD